MTHSEKDNNSIFKITLNLTLASMLSGIIIATVYYFTEPLAVIQRIKQKELSMKELVPSASAFIPIEGKEDWYRAESSGQLLSYIVLAHGKGYGGVIKILVAVTPDKKISGYKIMSHNETPGLGDQATKPKFSGQFAGKGIENLEVVKVHEEGKIDAITGATITSRAVTLAVKNALAELEEYINKSK